jgi:hypothetical protein
MTRDDIIRMALEAGFELHDGAFAVALWVGTENDLEHFADLVTAAEREACAKVCDDKVDAEYATGKVDHNEMGWTQACAAAIRARGQE